MSSIRSEVPTARTLSRALALAVLGAAAAAGACGQSRFPRFEGASGKDASTADLPGVEATAGSGGAAPAGSGGGSSSGGSSGDGSGGAGPAGTGGGAPGTGGSSAGGWIGGAGGDGTGAAGVEGTGGMGAGGPFVTVTAVVMGGPAGTSITPSSPTPGSSCAAGSCKIPVGGSVMVTAPMLTDWFFDAWTGGAYEAVAATYQMDALARDVALTAHYMNQRSEPCRSSPPDNAQTTDNPQVTTTYTTAGGWSTPATCPWKCMTGFCQTETSCPAVNIDAIALTGEIGGYGWYGGDDGSTGPRSVGVGQSLTPPAQVTMTRFGFDFDSRSASAFRYETTGKAASEPVLVELDRRDASGTILATYSIEVPPDFKGGWLFWDTPATVLAKGVTTIFTSWLPNAFTQPVTAGAIWAQADYAGGVGYVGEATSGDLKAWSTWYVHEVGDNLFRLQQHNPACK